MIDSEIETQRETINLPVSTITANKDLPLVLLKGTEGVGETYVTKISYEQCVEFFDIEDNLIPEREKLQREANAPRVKGIYEYLINRDDSIFPSACLVVSELDQESIGIEMGGVEIIKGLIPSHADRLFIDGQGRLSGIKMALKVKPELKDLHLDIKVIVVKTNTIRESSQKVRQVFSDFHMRLSKPNKSQNIFFDAATASSRFIKELLNITDKRGVEFGKAIALDGKIKHGQLYTLANVKDFIAIMVGEKNINKLNKTLDCEDNFNLYLALISDYIIGLYSELPLARIQGIESKTEWKCSLDDCVVTCAIGLKALAYLGRSLIEDALAKEMSELNMAALEAFPRMPIQNKEAALWVDNEIYKISEGKTTIVRASEKKLARIFCNKARVLPCEGLI